MKRHRAIPSRFSPVARQKSGNGFAISAPQPKIQTKLEIGSSNDHYEREADAMADQAVGQFPKQGFSSIQSFPNSTHSSRTLADENLVSQLQLTSGKGIPLPEQTRAEMEAVFGTDFSGVNIHTDGAADQMNQHLQSRAFTYNQDLYFKDGEYNPQSREGVRLLAHELTHAVQQSSEGQSRIQRDDEIPIGQSTVPEPTDMPPEPEWSRHLGQMLGCSLPSQRISGQNRYQHCVGLLTAIAQRMDLDQALLEPQLQLISERAFGNQDYERFIGQHKVMGVIALYYAGGDLQIANNLMNPGQADDLTPLTIRRNVGVDDWGRNVAFSYAVRALRGYAETFRAGNTADSIGSRPFDRPANAASSAVDYEQVLSQLIEELIRLLPQMNLTEAQRNSIYSDLLIVMRRSMVTGQRTNQGMQNVSRITNSALLANYRQLIGMLTQRISNRQQMSLITDSMPSFALPDPIPTVSNSSFQINGSTVSVDLSQVPTAETTAVRYGISQAIRTTWSGTSTIRFQNAYWPVTLPVRLNGNDVRIRYELVFDNDSNIRVERLGPSGLRQVDPGFAGLSVDDKKQQLMQDFGLTGIDDRRPLPAGGGRPAQPAANWTSDELNQVKAAYELLPQRDRAALQGVALVRDHVGPGGDTNLQGFAHTGRSNPHDRPRPPAHSSPHIHYYDSAFSSNDLSFVGPRGATGPRSDWTLIHEVGHMVMNLEQRGANADIAAAGTIPGIGFRTTNRAQLNAFSAWLTLSGQVATDIVAYNNAVAANPQTMTDAELDALEQTIEANQGPRDNALTQPNFPPGRVQAATNRDRIADRLYQASKRLRRAKNQNNIFIQLANRFGFHQFTNYARTGDPEEWFAETYALYITDPDRLNEMNRSIFLWFEAGMPFDASWNPPTGSMP